ncbi:MULTISPECIES: nicotinate (nicotinamide) nucleotide adenylyltransferase [Pseudothermotoga]|uniref:Probable nicotinate-nucleotide adenylyltransferase n=1 Tax=Pseudothermotoga lettingae (strain ATCC BAA-301 / DSM 14385 / NBRC 107922 / TMO) TaxID=416591 RepID=NADD_PSELT|nr:MULTISPECIES: nicotinate (nicotinamide) nucleotide adenylyltransferase [Pseudothermotoga]A8F479.1 RecName: Full=Probable nicotinate-nucleotide adenylyltransferase; AltName: Full=Deamido-NAD(+) diphosphorylase; AltName: Full=Deamido-NAD(+) pyrophosphorylase; AltName: Full=Nicotinate mononucleotide adenylyltransferase; Short=NaMN adenylyltransferase [Pseudothermotoga lettingae TMO]ABV32963.1 nicotinate (nicotinamide) nucleotide adenylyltransferase [Pseudothermotoga lettingae TMO]HBJ82066.1 nico
MNTKNKIGIFGGSFNPPHIGHLIISQYAIEMLQLDLLYIVPTYIPPHKSNDLAPFELRFKWCKITFSGPHISISDYEKNRQGISYSLYTVLYFSQLHRTKPYFITGEDSLSYIQNWHKYRDLLENCHFVVYPRYCNKPYEEHTRSVLKELYDSIIFLQAPLIQISASDIRKRIKERKSIKGMVHPQIEKQVIEYYSL